MSDDDEENEFEEKSSSQPDHRRRLTEIKFELQRLNREKKKYDVEKLTQNAEFLQGEINDINNAINDLNQQINQHTSTKKSLHIKMTNLRSRSQLRYANLTIALREKKRYEAELKKENKTEEYRELARRQIRNIDAALPILKEEDEYKERMKSEEDAQQAAMNKRKRLEENLHKNLCKQTEIRKMLSENSETLPLIESSISALRDERERLLLSTSNRKQRVHRTNSSIIRSVFSIEDDALEKEKEQMVEQLNKVKMLIRYFRGKMSLHGLEINGMNSSITNRQTSTDNEDEKSILSSFMDEISTDSNSTSEASAVAMKLPRNLIESNGNDIIHSSNIDVNEIEYKKEFSADILQKYGGVTKKTPQKKQRKVKKNENFAVSHPPHLIELYNNVRSSSGSFDTLPSMPMFEYELVPTIKSLESIEQSLEFYLNELSRRALTKSDKFCQNSSIDRQISDEHFRSISNDFESHVDL